MVFPPSKTRWTALALNSLAKLRLGLRGFLSSAMLDTVPTSRKVSTGADQAQSGDQRTDDQFVDHVCRMLLPPLAGLDRRTA